MSTDPSRPNPEKTASGFQPPASPSGATRADEIKKNPQCSISSDAKNEHGPRRIYLGITGPMQSGKDTLANAIADESPVEWREPFYHFANPLKEMAQSLLGGSISNYWGGDKDKNAETGFAADLGPAFATYRTALQYLGTEVFRQHVHPDIWIVLAKHRIDQMLKCNPSRKIMILFPDVRFDNEAQFIRDRGGIIVRVWRIDGKIGTNGIAGHQSESGISEDLITHRFAIGPNGHRDVARIILDQVGIQ